MERKRITAVKTRIKPMTSGKYIPQPGFDPNYILTSDGRKLSRVHVMATVVDRFLSETGKFASLTLDDGTDTIRAKIFNAVSIIEGIEIGNNIDFIGRVKEYQGEIFVAPEIISKVDDINKEILWELENKVQDMGWEQKRKTVFEYQQQVSDLEELKRFMHERFGIIPEDVEAILQSSRTEDDQEKHPLKDKESVLEMISKLDSGEGCDYADLIANSGMVEEKIDTIISELLEEGICFEPRPGKIKKL